ncbi:unnamed protein product [Ranitomeya imitator]|uniref:CCHC-type domain-containing protein n=1 Tax=Ranitomeya imitator TaxID=111125 RepID=A0ABN9M2D9_9NEOB|nr:unnamed protein product [Ranitomeya imitator]
MPKSPGNQASSDDDEEDDAEDDDEDNEDDKDDDEDEDDNSILNIMSTKPEQRAPGHTAAGSWYVPFVPSPPEYDGKVVKVGLFNKKKIVITIINTRCSEEPDGGFTLGGEGLKTSCQGPASKANMWQQSDQEEEDFSGGAAMKEDLTVSGSEGLMQSGSNQKAVKMETKGELSERPPREGQTLAPDPQPGVSDPTAVSQEHQRLVLGTSGDTAGRMTDHLVNNGTQQSYARPVLQQQQRSAAVSGVTPQVPADNVASDVQDNVASDVQDNVASDLREWWPAVSRRLVVVLLEMNGAMGHLSLQTPGDTVQALKRRNVVRFRHRGAREELPNRSFVIQELLCNQMGFRPTNIFALISLPDRQGYDVSFKVRSQLRHFWANFFKFRDVDGWNKFRFIPISKSDTVSVTINFWNEAVPPQYIVIWLQRHCDLMSDLTKERDADGIWTGGWRVLVKLRQSQNFTHHLPVSFYIGREKGICLYAGQPRECYKCGRTGHLASACAYSVVKCSLCGEVGHAKAKCWNVQCNLCGQIGCSQRDYPDSWHNEDLPVAAEDLEEEEALLLGSVLRPEPQSESSDSAQGARESSEGSSSPASVSNRENNESAQIKRRKKR